MRQFCHGKKESWSNMHPTFVGIAAPYEDSLHEPLSHSLHEPDAVTEPLPAHHCLHTKPGTCACVFYHQKIRFFWIRIRIHQNKKSRIRIHCVDSQSLFTDTAKLYYCFTKLIVMFAGYHSQVAVPVLSDRHLGRRTRPQQRHQSWPWSW